MAKDLLRRIRNLEIDLWVEGDNLRFSAPEGAMTPSLIEEIKASKADVIAALRQVDDPVRPVDRSGAIPLSPHQDRLWFLQRLNPDSPAFNSGLALWLSGPVTVQRLQHSLDQLVVRHEILRTVYEEQGHRGVQRVASPRPVPLTVQDPVANSEDALALSRLFNSAPMELSEAPQLKALWVPTFEDKGLLTLVVHHIAFDGRSADILVRELLQLLADSETSLDSVALQYGDYAAWADRRASGIEADRQIEAWRTRLEGSEPALPLPYDAQAPLAPSMEGGSVRREFPTELLAKLRDVGDQERSTLFMVALAAHYAHLHRITGEQDLVVGTPLSTRPEGLENTVGFFVNTLPLRNVVEGTHTLRHILRSTRDVALDAFQDSDVPLGPLVQKIRPGRDTSASPLFRLLFAFSETGEEELRAGSFTATPAPFSAAGAQFDLALTFSVRGDQGSIGFDFSRDVFQERTVQRMLDQLLEVLKAFATDPDQVLSTVPILSSADREFLDHWNNSTMAIQGPRLLHRGFEDRAREQPDAVALVQGDRTLTYGELDQWANGIAHGFQRRGLQPGDIAAVALQRSPEMIACLLAVLKAGAAYLPVDPAYPTERIHEMLNGASPALLITSEELLPQLALDSQGSVVLEELLAEVGQGANEPPRLDIVPTDRAYVIFTSGSTGVPKGVEVEHSSASHFVEFAEALFRLEPGKRMLQFISVSFDPSVHEIFTPLRAGATLVLRTDEMIGSTAGFLQACEDLQVDVVSLPTAFWHQIAGDLNEGQRIPPRVNTWIIGGEQVRRDHLRSWHKQRSPESRLLNLYGPTECSIASTWYELEGEDGYIGRPVWNTRCHLLDPYGNQVPVGGTGELYIAGAGVARGYLGDPQKTRERFMPEPGTGGRMYKTGDLVRLRSDGNLEFLGRTDNQVKIRGFRVELGEVESALGAHPDVVRAVVVPYNDPETSTAALAAYVVPRIDRIDLLETMRQHLTRRLPAHLVPTFFTAVDNIPMTVNGKVDKKALPKPSPRSSGVSYVPPGTETESILADIWCSVLGVDRIGVHDDFFELGGHSLSALRMVSRVRDTLGCDLTVREVFLSPTVRGLATAVDALDRAPSPTSPTDSEQVGLLAPQQEGMWYLWSLAPESPAFNMSFVLRLEGPLDVDALERALETVVQRQEALRTRFVSVEGTPRAEVVPDMRVPLARVEIPDETRDRVMAAQRQISFILSQPFDLATGPLASASLLRLAPDDHVLAIVVHHIVSDGVSMTLIADELEALYRLYTETPEAKPLPPIEYHYRDYAARQRRGGTSALASRGLGHWIEQLRDAPATPFFTGDHQRPAEQTLRGDTEFHSIPGELADRVEALGRSHGATPFMTYLALFCTFVSRYARQSDFLVGYPTDGRDSPQVEGVVGYFVNTLVHRAQFAADTRFLDVLAATRQSVLDGLQYQGVPLDRIVEAVQPPRSASFHPLFQVMFTYLEGEYVAPEFPGLRASHFPAGPETSQFDLTFNVIRVRDEARLRLDYSSDLFEGTTARRILSDFVTLLGHLLDAPKRPVSSVDLFASGERSLLLHEWNKTEVEYEQNGACLHELVEAQVQRTPHAPALRFGGAELTYSAMEQGANRLANALLERGLTPGTLVAVCLVRSLELPMVLLGIMKAGCAYVPLDPDLPHRRMEQMLADQQNTVVVTTTELQSRVPVPQESLLLLDDSIGEWQRASESKPQVDVSSNDLAYVLYTSGSTGRPKGVMNEHRGIVNRLLWMVDLHPMQPGERVVQKTPYSFDVSIWEFFWPLASGGTLVLAEPGGHMDPAYLIDLIATERIDYVHFVPSMLRLFLEREEELHRCGSVQKVFCSGEALTPDLVARFFKHFSCGLYNFYGPTEAAVEVAAWECMPSADLDSVPIGRPVPNTRLYVLDVAGAPCPVGVPGELHIAGKQVARGYLGRPELTREAFVPDPFASSGARMYRTGDLARWRDDGAIEFLGRVDNQVKIRGYRVELGEVEGSIEALPEVSNAVAVVRTEDGDDRLVAYVVFNSGSGGSPSEVRRDLREILPSYMIPSAVIPLSALPLTSSGKVDRQALPSPNAIQQGSVMAAQELSETEETLAGVWQEILGVDQVTADDNFFDLGGHSLQSMKVLHRIEEITGQRLSPRALMLQTMGQIADELDGAVAGSGSA